MYRAQCMAFIFNAGQTTNSTDLIPPGTTVSMNRQPCKAFITNDDASSDFIPPKLPYPKPVPVYRQQCKAFISNDGETGETTDFIPPKLPYSLRYGPICDSSSSDGQVVDGMAQAQPMDHDCGGPGNCVECDGPLITNPMFVEHDTRRPKVKKDIKKDEERPLDKVRRQCKTFEEFRKEVRRDMNRRISLAVLERQRKRALQT